MKFSPRKLLAQTALSAGVLVALGGVASAAPSPKAPIQPIVTPAAAAASAIAGASQIGINASTPAPAPTTTTPVRRARYGNRKRPYYDAGTVEK